MRTELTIEIDRPPEDVFAYLADVSNLTEWQSGVHSAEVEGGAAAAKGAHVVECRTLLGKELTTTLEIVDFDPPRLFTLRALEGPALLTVRHELEPSGGETELRVVVEGEVRHLPGFAAGLMMRGAERQFRKNFERLKRVLESQA
ncbi:MAG TPA: SRPBCC family protein [Gaiellaceae bacterium]|nr:SRPBCC family protein [Gaiellaceae bacterium]